MNESRRRFLKKLAIGSVVAGVSISQMLELAKLGKGVYLVYLDGATYKAIDGTTGALVDSDADPGHVIQACITDAGTNPFVLVLKPNTDFAYTSTVPAFNKNATGWQKVIGHGARITLGSGAPRAFDFNRTADYDAFQYAWLEGFDVDCNNVGGEHHVILGTNIGGSSTPRQRVNIQDVVIRDIHAYNIPVDATKTNHRLGIWLVSQHLGEGETQTVLQRIKIHDVRLDGGNQGITVAGTISSGHLANIFMDQIDIQRCWHSLLSVQASQFSAANFFVGSYGFGGSCHIADCYGRYSGDVGVEIDNMTDALVENVIIEDAHDAFYCTNFNNPLDPAAQEITWSNCTARRITYPAASVASGFSSSTQNAIAMGKIIIDGCSYYSAVPSAAHSGEAMDFENTGAIDSMEIRNFHAQLVGGYCTPFSISPAFIKRLVIDGLRVEFANAERLRNMTAEEEASYKQVRSRISE